MKHNIYNRITFVIIAGFLFSIILISNGCESVKLDGFSAGVAILNTDVRTFTTNELGNYGELKTKQITKVNELMPIFLLNFKFD